MEPMAGFYKLFAKLFQLNRWHKTTIKVTFDAFAVFIALSLAYAVRLENFQYLYDFRFYLNAVLAAVIATSVFFFFRLYSVLTRHVSTETALAIFFGSAISALVLVVGRLYSALSIPLSVPFIYLIFLYMIASSARYLVRALGDELVSENTRSIVIYGAGKTGAQILGALRKDPFYEVKYFIDDNKQLHGRILGGKTIYSVEEFQNKIQRDPADILLLATGSIKYETFAHIPEIAAKNNLKVKKVRNLSNLLSSPTNIKEFEDTNIEDFLGRSAVKPVKRFMESAVKGKSILVTGAGGSIGSEICKEILNSSPSLLVVVDISEAALYVLMQKLNDQPALKNTKVLPRIGSVRDDRFLQGIFTKFDIDVIYHAAAYKHVPLMEENVTECVSNNSLGTLNVAVQAVNAGVSQFVLISTDKAVNPPNVMGASKRLAELICLNLRDKGKTKFSVVRFGNVLGSSGSVIPLFRQQIANGGPVTLTHSDITRYFMTIPEAAQLVIQTAALSTSGDIFVLDMGAPIKIRDLAEKMIVLSGKNPITNPNRQIGSDDIEIKTTGLRPGEKMHEELSYQDQMVQTAHPKIFKALEEAPPRDLILKTIEDAEIAIANGEQKRLLSVLSRIAKDLVDSVQSKDFMLR